MSVTEVKKDFDAELHFQLLRSEKLRVTTIGVLLIFGLALFLFQSMRPGSPIPDDKKDLLFIPAIILVLGILVEFFFRILINRIFKNRSRYPAWLQFLNLLVEISIPSSIVFWNMNVNGNFLGLGGAGANGYFVFIFLSVMRLEWKLCLTAGILAAFQYGGLIYYGIWDQPDAFPLIVSSNPIYLYGRSITMIIAGLVVTFVATQLRTRIEDAIGFVQERNQILETFGKHVSPEVVNQLINQDYDIETRDVTILFLDIRNFTSYAENRSPVEVIGRLNESFAYMIDIINDNHGIINKFLGDGFMAVFGAPLANGNNVLNAVNAARSILKELDKRNDRLPDDTIQIGIGIHNGECVTGSVGSPRRKEYSIIGDAVNLAARMQSMNKKLNTRILISQSVVDVAGLPNSELKKMPLLRVRGRNELLQAYTIEN